MGPTSNYDLAWAEFPRAFTVDPFPHGTDHTKYSASMGKYTTRLTTGSPRSSMVGVDYVSTTTLR